MLKKLIALVLGCVLAVVATGVVMFTPIVIGIMFAAAISMLFNTSFLSGLFIFILINGAFFIGIAIIVDPDKWLGMIDRLDEVEQEVA